MQLPDFSCSGHIRANYQRCGMNGNNGNKRKDNLIINVLCIRCNSNCVRESQKLFWKSHNNRAFYQNKTKINTSDVLKMFYTPVKIDNNSRHIDIFKWASLILPNFSYRAILHIKVNCTSIKMSFSRSDIFKGNKSFWAGLYYLNLSNPFQKLNVWFYQLSN